MPYVKLKDLPPDMANELRNTEGRAKDKLTDEQYDTLQERARQVYIDNRNDKAFRCKANYSSRRSFAKREGVTFTIKLNEIEYPDTCPLTGITIDYVNGDRQYDSPSLDRLIPELGYVKGNVKVISGMANRMKGIASKEECLAFARNIKSYFGETE